MYLPPISYAELMNNFVSLSSKVGGAREFHVHLTPTMSEPTPKGRCTDIFIGRSRRQLLRGEALHPTDGRTRTSPTQRQAAVPTGSRNPGGGGDPICGARRVAHFPHWPTDGRPPATGSCALFEQQAGGMYLRRNKGFSGFIAKWSRT